MFMIKSFSLNSPITLTRTLLHELRTMIIDVAMPCCCLVHNCLCSQSNFELRLMCHNNTITSTSKSWCLNRTLKFSCVSERITIVRVHSMSFCVIILCSLYHHFKVVFGCLQKPIIEAYTVKLLRVSAMIGTLQKRKREMPELFPEFQIFQSYPNYVRVTFSQSFFLFIAFKAALKSISNNK